MGGLVAGKSALVAVDLTPGNYVALCFIPDPKTRKPHFMLGMATPFTVSAQTAGAPGTLPNTGTGSTAQAIGALTALAGLILFAGAAARRKMQRS